MTKKELVKYLKEMTEIYYYNGDKETLLNVWYRKFKNVSENEFKQAYEQATDTLEHLPTPAHIKKLISKNTHLSTEDAFEVLNKLLNPYLTREQLLEYKEKYPLIYKIFKENKQSLMDNRYCKANFIKLYKQELGI